VARCDEPRILPFPSGKVKCLERLGGLLNHYYNQQLSDSVLSPTVNRTRTRRNSGFAIRAVPLGAHHPILRQPRATDLDQIAATSVSRGQ
jgi:hypothetical protein